MIWENYRMVNCGIGILDWKKELGDVPWKEKPPVTTRSLGIYWSHQFGMFFFHRVFSAGKTLQKPRCNRGVKGKRWLDVTGCLERPTCVFKGSCHVYIALFQRLHHLNFVVVFAQRHTSIRFKGRDFLQSPYIPTSSSGPHHLSVATKMSLPPPPKKKTYPTHFPENCPHLLGWNPTHQLPQLRENFIHPGAIWPLDATAAKGLALTHPNGFTRTAREPTLAQCAQPRATRGGVWLDVGSCALSLWVWKGEASQNSYFFKAFF